LSFATTQLAPRAPTNPEFLEDLEQTMALLIFPSDNLEPKLARLLHPDLRKSVADRVNKAILSSQGQRRDAAIRTLVRLRAWAEEKARESKKDIPAQLNLGLDADMENDGNEYQENGHDTMVT
jgi:glucose-induced degradation protein 8